MITWDNQEAHLWSPLHVFFIPISWEILKHFQCHWAIDEDSLRVSLRDLELAHSGPYDIFSPSLCSVVSQKSCFQNSQNTRLCWLSLRVKGLRWHLISVSWNGWGQRLCLLYLRVQLMLKLFLMLNGNKTTQNTLLPSLTISILLFQPPVHGGLWRPDCISINDFCQHGFLLPQQDAPFPFFSLLCAFVVTFLSQAVSYKRL